MSDIDATLAERGSRYGNFDEHAEVTQSIKAAMQSGNNWLNLPDDMKEALEMTAHKIGRILNGDPNYIDSWTDICGYNRLVEKRLIAEQESAKAFMNSREETSQGPAPDKAADDCGCPACTLRRLFSGPKPGETVPAPEAGNTRSVGAMLSAAVALPNERASAGISSDEIISAFKTLLDAGAIAKK